MKNATSRATAINKIPTILLILVPKTAFIELLKVQKYIRQMKAGIKVVLFE